MTRAGPHVWVAGIVGQAQDGSIPPMSSISSMFDVAITIMDMCPKAARAGAEHVAKVQVFMTDYGPTEDQPAPIAYFADNR